VDWTDPTDFDAYANIPRLLARAEARRAAVRVYTGHFPFYVRDELGDDLVTLTLLRDPVARTISTLKHFNREEPHRQLSLEAIYDTPPIYKFFIRNYQTKAFALGADDREVALNCALVIDDARYALACERLAEVDVLGLTESYGQFIDELRDRFGWW